MRRFASLLLIGVVVGVLVGAFFVGRSGYDAYRRNKQIEEEITQLQKEAERLSSENEVLERKIMYFKTDDFTEREAKERLQLKHKDEKVVAVKGRSVETPQEEGPRVSVISGGEVSESDDFVPVYKKWWDVFFAPNKE